MVDPVGVATNTYRPSFFMFSFILIEFSYLVFRSFFSQYHCLTELNRLQFGQPQDTRRHSFSCRDTISQEKEPEKMIILKIKRLNWSSSQINLFLSVHLPTPSIFRDTGMKDDSGILCRPHT